MSFRKSFFTSGTVTENCPREFVACSSIRFYAVSGSVTVTFADGGEIPVVRGDIYEAHANQVFEKITIKASAGASASFVYGDGHQMAAASGVGGAASGVQLTTGSPEGVLNASAGQLAYDSDAPAYYLNPNTSGTTGWVQLI